MIPIEVPEGGEPNSEGPLEEAYTPPNLYLETAMLALESENGVAVETNTRANASAMRHRFYREIAKAVKDGNDSLRSVTISLHKSAGDGWELHLKNLPFKVRQL